MKVMELTLADIQRLPKTDLHVHLDGSLRLSTMLELAEEQGIELPADTPEALSKALHCGEKAGSLVEYLKAFDTTLKVMQTAEALYRVAYELIEGRPFSEAAAELTLEQKGLLLLKCDGLKSDAGRRWHRDLALGSFVLHVFRNLEV